MGRHNHPEEEVERAYFRPPPPPPVVRSGSTRVATAELPLPPLVVNKAGPEPTPEYVWVWPTSRDTVDAIGEAVFYLSIGFFGGLGVIYLFQYVL